MIENNKFEQYGRNILVQTIEGTEPLGNAMKSSEATKIVRALNVLYDRCIEMGHQPCVIGKDLRKIMDGE